MDFESFDLSPRLKANAKALGFLEATPIQEQAIPVILAGRDVLGVAQTGTGKTAAFGLPALNALQKGPRNRLRALVIAPTRELTEQIFDALGAMGRGTGCSGLTIYGGVNIQPQIQKLRRGAEIAVACPGRLLDHVRRRTIDLSHVEMLILDEADQMFDMGFLPDIREVIKHLPKVRQNLLFSATMPDDIRHLADEILRDPVNIQAGFIAPVETVSHALYPVQQHQKPDLLMELLRDIETESVLVFTRTKHRAQRVGEKLQQAGMKAASLQGNLSQARRQAVMEGFRRGKHQILVATDIAARGIDVSRISHVINLDIPDTVDAYTHRIGRTGRACKTGDAFTFVTRGDMSMVRQIERVLGEPIERREVKGFDYGSSSRGGDGERRRSSGGSQPQRRRPSGNRDGAAPRWKARPKSGPKGAFVSRKD